MLKVVHITNSARGGAGIAAMRLHQSLQHQGIASAFVSKNLTLNYEGVEIKDAFFDYKKPSFLQKLIRKVKSLIGLNSSLVRSQQLIEDKVDQISCEIWSLPYCNYDMLSHPLVKEATVVNLHWVSGVLDYSSFFGTISKPIVWTLHDMNPFLGIYHYADDTARNASIIPQLEAQVRTIKKTAIQKVRKGALIAPSQWLLNEAIESGIFDAFEIQKRIPYAIDLEIFNLQSGTDKRLEYKIPAEDTVLLFIADKQANFRKGQDLLIAALAQMNNVAITVVVVGHGQLGDAFKGVNVVSLGLVNGPVEMAKCYAMADAFILPSREDNLPNVMLESFASGVPVIAFNVGGMKEHIKDFQTGVVAQEMTAEALATAIQLFSENRTRFDEKKIRAYAEEQFPFAKQGQAYLEVYNKLLEA